MEQSYMIVTSWAVDLKVELNMRLALMCRKQQECDWRTLTKSVKVR
jgi:hypothetical protein